ncbi:MAG: thioredoxin family protein [Betaproteobacteria bacterium]|nr:MAG: thioredoxin family protein [Betaproteobacteria bacterium]
MAATPSVGDLGAPAPDFELVATDARRYRRDALRGPNGLLVMFICNHCPYVKAVIDKIVRDAGELKLHGIGSVAICSNDPDDYPEDSFDNMKTVAARLRLPFPYLWDETQEIAKAYGAVCTPDFFGYSADLKLQYRGRLDDSGRSAKPDAPRELFNAMVQVARTGRGPERQTASIGCSIKWRA